MAAAYEAPLYSAPAMLSAMHSLVSLPRFQHSQDVVDLFSSDRNVRKNYTYGLVVYCSIMGAIFLLWATALITLKLRGNSVGCASGKAFRTNMAVTDSSVTVPHDGGASGSTDLEEWPSSGSSENAELPNEEEQSNNNREERQNSTDSINEADLEDIQRIEKRQRRTRLAFLGAAIVNLTCTALLLVFAFNPIHDTKAQTEVVFDAAQETINQVNAAVVSIGSAAAGVSVTASTVNLNFDQICPNVQSNADYLGVDLQDLASVMKAEIKDIEETAQANVTSAKEAVDQIQDGLDDIQSTVDSANDKLWVFPALLLCVCVTTVAAGFSLMLVWRGRAGPCVRKTISKCVIPALILFTVICWVAAVATAVATITSSDTCIAGQSGSPDEMIQSVLDQSNISQTEYLYTMVSAYTNGCRADDPTKDFSKLEEKLQVSIGTIWQHLSLVDSIGKAELEQACGGSLDDLLLAARSLARGLTLIKKSLDSVIGSLECPRISPMYIEAVHDILCTDTADGIAWAYLLMSIVSVCMMTMVTLRASLYEAVKEEKVYDESEVAQNMFLDEHEEYLAYISKYKHEWQEYDGINRRDMPETADSVAGSIEAEPDEMSGPASVESVDGEENVSIIEKLSDLEESWPFADEYLSNAGSETGESDDETGSSYEVDSIATDDISFQSLRSSVVQQGQQRNAAAALPSLLPGMAEEDEEDSVNENIYSYSRPPSIRIHVQDEEGDNLVSPYNEDRSPLDHPYSPTRSVGRGRDYYQSSTVDMQTGHGREEVELSLSPKHSIGMFHRHDRMSAPTETRDDIDTRFFSRSSLRNGSRRLSINVESRDSPDRDRHGREIAWVEPPNALSSPREHPYLRNSRRGATSRPPTPSRRRTPKIKELIGRFDHDHHDHEI